MLFYCDIILILALHLKGISTNSKHSIISGGGYSAQLCLQLPDLKKEKSIFVKCNDTRKPCTSGTIHLCPLPCNFTAKQKLINNQMHTFAKVPKPVLKLSSNNNPYYDSDNLIFTIETGNFSLLMENEIHILFSVNISCKSKTIIKSTLKCQLKFLETKLNSIEKVNVSIRFGFNCSNTTFMGQINILNQSALMKLFKEYYWILIITSFIIILLWITTCMLNKMASNRKLALKDKKALEMKFLDYQLSFTKSQIKTLNEYQTTTNSSNTSGKLTPRHLLSFGDYMTRVLDVDLKTKLNEGDSKELELFKTKLLSKSELIKWIDSVEGICRLQDRYLVASYLTIFLIQHPLYFLDIMKTLISKFANKLKSNSEERTLFIKSESIGEMMVAYWLHLLMYENLKTGIIGQRFFSLYRAIECKMKTGLIDHFTSNANYTLSMDYLLTNDIKCEELKIKASVKVNLKLMNSSQDRLYINFQHFEVIVLSMDSISQVKDKILDKAIKMHVEKENFDMNNENYHAIDAINIDDFNLYFLHNNVKILLQNFDRTSIRSEIDADCIVINTLKHYKITVGTKLHLDSMTTSQQIGINLPINVPPTKVHLLIPNNCESSISEIINSNEQIMVFKPLIDNGIQEADMMILLLFKITVISYVNDFFKSITNWKSLGDSIFSTKVFANQFPRNSFQNASFDSKVILNGNNQYIKTVYYLFTMLDDIAQSLLIDDKVITQSWKNQSFICQFWVNLIQNPHYIFSMNESALINSSLKTISNVLKSSGSIGFPMPADDKNESLTNQLFIEEINNQYSHWWMSLIDSTTRVSDYEMGLLMDNVVDQNQMGNYTKCALRNLQIISKTLFPKPKLVVQIG